MVLHCIWRRLFDASLAALESISPGKGIVATDNICDHKSNNSNFYLVFSN